MECFQLHHLHYVGVYTIPLDQFLLGTFAEKTVVNRRRLQFAAARKHPVAGRHVNPVYP